MNDQLGTLFRDLKAVAFQAGDLAADVAYAFASQAGKCMDRGKRSVKIAHLKSDIRIKMQELGELLYATHTGSPTDSEVLLSKMQEIDALTEQLRQVEEEDPHV